MWWLLAAGGAAALLLLTRRAAADVTPRPGDNVGVFMPAPLGIRNRNPGNLRPNRFLGVTGQADGYAVYRTYFYGVRAAARQLKLYVQRDGLLSVREIITKWAPHSENPTAQYVDFVANRVGVNPDAALAWDDGRYSDALLAIFEFELGEPITTWVPGPDVTAGIQAGLTSVS